MTLRSVHSVGLRFLSRSITARWLSQREPSCAPSVTAHSRLKEQEIMSKILVIVPTLAGLLAVIWYAAAVAVFLGGVL